MACLADVSSQHNLWYADGVGYPFTAPIVSPVTM